MEIKYDSVEQWKVAASQAMAQGSIFETQPILRRIGFYVGDEYHWVKMDGSIEVTSYFKRE